MAPKPARQRPNVPAPPSDDGLLCTFPCPLPRSYPLRVRQIPPPNTLTRLSNHLIGMSYSVALQPSEFQSGIQCSAQRIFHSPIVRAVVDPSNGVTNRPNRLIAVAGTGVSAASRAPRRGLTGDGNRRLNRQLMQSTRTRSSSLFIALGFLTRTYSGRLDATGRRSRSSQSVTVIRQHEHTL